ncbi:cytochrome P450 [Streptomyces iranensis]|uniref:cytochrome P450 n=1 Tax=Streptomyces iranensis TaxID=576784 RepID=UPI0039B73D8A
MRTPTSCPESSAPASLSATITISELDTDPFPVYERLRDGEPVSWVPAAHAYLVTRWEDVHRICRDTETFSAAVHDSPLSQAIGPNLLHSDGAYHDRLRAPLTEGLRPSVIQRTVERAVRDNVRSLLGELRAHTEVDLVSGFAQSLAVRTLQQVTGLPDMPVSVFTTWVDGIAAGAANYERDRDKQRQADEAGAAVDGMVRRQLQRGPEPGTLLAGLAASGATFDEIAATTKLLLIGGMQEPRDLFGHALIAYLNDQEVRREIDRDKTVIVRLVEEALRLGSPVGTVTRRVTTRTVVSGVTLDEGSLVLAVLASANRDPRHWDSPDEFHLWREHNQHVAFSAGVHSCVGATLARTQVRVALEELLAAYPALRLAEEPVVRGWEFRGPTSLMVHLGKAGSSGPARDARAAPASAPTIPLRVADVQKPVGDVAAIVLRHEQGDELPPWSPGAHIDLTFAGSDQRLRRSYSLCGDLADRHSWRIGVRRSPDSRGGSAFLVDGLEVGDVLEATPPRNAFRLITGAAPEYLLVAGGIGITPLLPMARSLTASGTPWRLLYIGRDQDSMPFLDEVEALAPAVDIWTTADQGRPNLSALLQSVPEGTEIYACGPAGMLHDLATAAADRPAVTLRVERFGAPAGPGVTVEDGCEFRVWLARTRKEIVVPKDKTLLHALEDAGIMVPSTCREGVCGSCETAVLAGAVEHRDHQLTDDEKKRGDIMLVCVSRSRGEKLTLNL